MDEKFDTADKKVLVDIVKLAQKRGLKGEFGEWKEFLNSHDKKFGAGVSDPSKRSHEILAAFLKTFSNEDDLKFFDNILRHHSNQYLLDQLKDNSHDSPYQSLVQLTLQHPLYPLDYSFPSIDEGWIILNLRKKKIMKSTEMFAVDCEMVLCEDGTEALVKVCVVDHNLEVKLNELVKPEKEIVDYRTEITGVSSQDLVAVTCSLSDIQKSMKKLLANGAILVGHSLHNDLRVLKVYHVRVVDTAYIFQSSDGSLHRRPSLNNLCKTVLGYEVRKDGAPHNCLDDARAAMELFLARIKHGVDKDFPVQLQEPVSESEMAKLLLHKIPTTVNSKTLDKVLPGDYTIEVKPSKKAGQGNKYSAFAIFKNPLEAHNAYESIQSTELKDSNGIPQKLVKFQLDTGMTASVFVRKMTTREPRDSVALKRGLQTDDEVLVSKKSKCDNDAQLKEIEALNERLKESESEIESLREQLKQKDLDIGSLRVELSKKDYEINMLNKMVASIKKRARK
ncbi:hypothetical protein HN51_001080 [Arachis hypogaea]|uniref:Exonuclease domain-containing protein n=1 Tax=Arachis hypogaea TaxID=3818 RepID=A0A445ET00_ARAHY|nr:small RNA degrading nuclease 1 isoform X1 [Arachis hypogaea]QHO49120.1 Small RNA degrading nuclease [Arachis hypogaea]RYR78644.1 hypothetical protein Ahy_A01g003475 [Arachis hypogaea]